MDIERILSDIDDLGATSTDTDAMRRILNGTEHLIDTDPRIAYNWGALHALEIIAGAN